VAIGRFDNWRVFAGEQPMIILQWGLEILVMLPASYVALLSTSIIPKVFPSVSWK
jgi:hypothetical protein